MEEKITVIDENVNEIMDETKPEETKPKKKKGKIVAIVIVCLLLVAGIVGGIVFLVSTNSRYDYAVSISRSDPIEAYYMFGRISWYKDAEEQQAAQKDVILEVALEKISSGDLEKASQLLDLLGNYPGVEDARAQWDLANRENIYNEAVSLFDAGLYGSAKTEFEKILGYKDVDDYLDRFAFKLEWYYPSLTYDSSYDFVQMYFTGDTLTMGSGVPTTYLYVIVESDEDYECYYGDYEVWIMGEMYNGEKIYYDSFSQTQIFGIKNPQYDEDGMVSEFYAYGMIEGDFVMDVKYLSASLD